jgi:4-amino-4-deoxy-L-arabinose transferase-like glycosyltransferase
VRDEGATLIISDNSLLQVGNELGVVMMVFFIVILVVTLRRLAKTARGDPENDLAAGAMLAILGLIVSGQFHHVFQTFAVSWLVWGMAGLGLAAAARGRSADDREQDTSGEAPLPGTVTPV